MNCNGWLIHGEGKTKMMQAWLATEPDGDFMGPTIHP